MHVFKDSRWTPCACLKTKRKRDALKDAGVTGAPKELRRWCDGFASWARAAVRRNCGVSVLRGTPSQVMEAANTLAALAAKTGTSRAVKLSDLVDDCFDRERKKGRFKTQPAFMVIICGVEPPHSYNGPTLFSLVTRRRMAGLPTVIATTAPLHRLYGEAATESLGENGEAATFNIEANEVDE